MLLLDLGQYHTISTTTGRNAEMARHTRIKLAALATSFVAAIGVMSIAPATASHAGGSVSNLRDGRFGCC
jgi:hypothetical protein